MKKCRITWCGLLLLIGLISCDFSQFIQIPTEGDVYDTTYVFQDANSFSFQLVDQGSDIGKLYLMIPKKSQEEDESFAVYISTSNNIQTLDDCYNNGTRLTSAVTSSPYISNLPSDQSDYIAFYCEISNLDMNQTYYINSISTASNMGSVVSSPVSINNTSADTTFDANGSGIESPTLLSRTWSSTSGTCIDVTNSGTSRQLDIGTYTGSTSASTYHPLTSHGNAVRDEYNFTEQVEHDFMITAQNRALAEELRSSSAGRSVARNISADRSIASDIAAEVIGTEKTFLDSGRTYTATLKHIGTASTDLGNKTVKVWVEDTTLSGAKGVTITDSMIEVMGNRFLKPGDDNDIYDWVTNIFGEEWGTHSTSYLIPETNEINILLADLQGDNSTNGGLLGFFWGKDNFYRSSQSRSNERIMFYLDSILYCQSQGGSWSEDDYWPTQIISTLGHEFQHMIGFYQASIKRNLSSETWVTEMLSLATEELLINKLGFTGTTARNSRISTFNDHNDTPFYTWLSGYDNSNSPYVLRSYALMYAYGSYLIRSFDSQSASSNILRDMMYFVDDKESLESLLSSKSYEHIPEMYQDVLVSGNASASGVFNSASIFNQGDVDYSLDAINFYDYGTPYLYTPEERARYFGFTHPADTMVLMKLPGISGDNHVYISDALGGDDISIIMTTP